MREHPNDPMNAEYREKTKLESFRNGLFQEIKKAPLNETRLRHKKRLNIPVKELN